MKKIFEKEKMGKSGTWKNSFLNIRPIQLAFVLRWYSGHHEANIELNHTIFGIFL